QRRNFNALRHLFSFVVFLLSGFFFSSKYRKGCFFVSSKTLLLFFWFSCSLLFLFFLLQIFSFPIFVLLCVYFSSFFFKQRTDTCCPDSFLPLFLVRILSSVQFYPLENEGRVAQCVYIYFLS